ncbi:MAG: hypothetical protein R3309_12760 [Reinekea sp.]|nr:hypothetical protein [Reinekea sp.]
MLQLVSHADAAVKSPRTATHSKGEYIDQRMFDELFRYLAFFGDVRSKEKQYQENNSAEDQNWPMESQDDCPRERSTNALTIMPNSQNTNGTYQNTRDSNQLKVKGRIKYSGKISSLINMMTNAVIAA